MQQPVIKVKQVPECLAGLGSFNLDQDTGRSFTAQLTKIHPPDEYSAVCTSLGANGYLSKFRCLCKSVVLNEEL